MEVRVSNVKNCHRKFECCIGASLGVLLIFSDAFALREANVCFSFIAARSGLDSMDSGFPYAIFSRPTGRRDLRNMLTATVYRRDAGGISGPHSMDAKKKA